MAGTEEMAYKVVVTVDFPGKSSEIAAKIYEVLLGEFAAVEVQGLYRLPSVDARFETQADKHQDNGFLGGDWPEDF
jgi:hypothetical protein